MTHQQALSQWMRDRGFDYQTLAEATGDSYSNIYMMARGLRPVNDAFKWRFAQQFGWDEAQTLFAATPDAQPLVVEPTPA
jgi:hypothetical protein